MVAGGMDSTIDLSGTLTVDDLARLLRVSPRWIRALVREGRFPIAPMPPLNQKPRWWGPSVRAWCEQRGYGVPAPAPVTEEPTTSGGA